MVTLLAKVSGPQYYLPASVNIASSVQSQCHVLAVVAGDEPGVDFFVWMIFL